MKEPRRQQPWVMLGVGLVAFAGIVWGLDRPLLSRIRRQRALWRERQVQAADAELVLAQGAKQDAAFEQVQQAYQALARRLARSPSLAAVLEQLGRRATEQGLELTATQPKGSVEPRLIALGLGIRLREVPLTLQLTGRYRDIGEFLAVLPREPFLASVHRLAITKQEAEGVPVQADLALLVYLPDRRTETGAGAS